MTTVLALAGDGVGPEVMAEALETLEAVARLGGRGVRVESGLVGGAALDEVGVPLPEEVLARARAADAVLFGAVGGPQWDQVGFERRPELAILGLRSGLGLYANLRPARVFDALVDASTLKPEVVRGLDLMIVREAVGGVYFGQPRGIETTSSGDRRGYNTESYSEPEIRRIARVAFDLARTRSGRVVSAEKANVMESGLVWRETVAELGARDYPDVLLSHMYADNCAMQLARNPRQFDVLLTTNLFGDLLSDLASMLTGSLGLLPSATLGAGRDGRTHGLFEPIHGSAPDIAGRGVANPIAQILSLALMLRWSLGWTREAEAVEAACAAALDAGARTADLGGGLTTREMGRAVRSRLEAQFD